MTLQQLAYIKMTAECGNITEAAEKLFISQPSLSAAIHNLEKEMGVTIFVRSKKGVVLTREGEELLSYAGMLLEQADIMKEHFGVGKARMPKFSVSCQHYSFAVNAFVDVVQAYDAEKYDFILRETQTGEIIDDVANGKSELIEDQVGGYVDKMLNERLLSVLSTKENVNLATLGFEEENVKKYQAIITPIDIAGERLGTLFIYRSDSQYDIDDIILSEYGTTVVGLEMMRSVNEENAEETRKVQIVKSAISTLSFSELEAIIHIFEELDGNEGILVASKIADRVGITRSVIVNALRKFESAGVIESRSSGMKGTYIKVLNDVVFDELKAIKASNSNLK